MDKDLPLEGLCSRDGHAAREVTAHVWTVQGDFGRSATPGTNATKGGVP
jgi:hypothetical protein